MRNTNFFLVLLVCFFRHVLPVPAAPQMVFDQPWSMYDLWNILPEEDGAIQDIFFQPNGDLLLKTTDKMYRYNGYTCIPVEERTASIDSSIQPPTEVQTYFNKDDIVNWKLDSKERLWVLTKNGLYEWSDRHWIHEWQKNEYINTEDRVEKLLETPSQQLLITTQKPLLFVEQKEAWKEVPLEEPLSGPVLNTGDRNIFTTQLKGSSLLVILQWDNNRFVPISFTLLHNRMIDVLGMKEGPDGSIWVYGTRCLVKWERDKREWLEYINCPPPVFIDKEGKVWFFDQKQIEIYNTVSNHWESSIPVDMGNTAILTISPQGMVIHVTDEDLKKHTGIHTIHQLIWDQEEQLHVLGRTFDSSVVEAVYSPQGGWEIYPRPQFNDTFIVRASIDPQQGIWYSHHSPDPNHAWSYQESIYHANRQPIKKFLISPLPKYPFVDVPHLHIDHKSNVWLYDFPFGILYFDPDTNVHRNYENIPAEAPVTLVEGEQAIWFAIARTKTKTGKILSYNNRNWQEWEANMEREVYGARLQNDLIFLSARNGYYLINESSREGPVYCALPEKGSVTKVLRQKDGTLWLQVEHPFTGSRVYCKKMPQHPPQAYVQANNLTVREDEEIQLQFYALEKFKPRDQWKQFNFSWRLNNGEWSAWSPENKRVWHYDELPSRTNHLDLKVRNQSLMESDMPFRFTFYVQPLPLQQQTWFLPIIAIILTLILFLVFIVLWSRYQVKHYALNLEKMVEERTNELNQTQNHILTITEHEQQRIGQELHDDVVQELVGIALNSEVLLRQLRQRAPEVIQELEKILGKVDEATLKTRRLARGLAPVNLDKLGLVSALQTLCSGISHFYGIECTLQAPDHLQLENNEQRLNLFRIAQEAAHNAIKHVRAQHIAISLAVQDNQVTLRVDDDGEGFDPAEHSEGMGLQIMRCRANSLNGDLQIHSRKGEGTSVICAFPLSA